AIRTRSAPCEVAPAGATPPPVRPPPGRGYGPTPTTGQTSCRTTTWWARCCATGPRSASGSSSRRAEPDAAPVCLIEDLKLPDGPADATMTTPQPISDTLPWLPGPPVLSAIR